VSVWSVKKFVWRWAHYRFWQMCGVRALEDCFELSAMQIWLFASGLPLTNV